MNSVYTETIAEKVDKLGDNLSLNEARKRVHCTTRVLKYIHPMCMCCSHTHKRQRRTACELSKSMVSMNGMETSKLRFLSWETLE